MLVVAVISLIQLTAPTGRQVYINPSEISSIREPVDVAGHWPSGVKCVVLMGNGRFNAVAEGCDEVRRKLRHESHGAPCALVCGGRR